jgi:hypothetical protein
LLSEEVLQTEFEVVHPQYALDGAFTQFAGQGQDIRGDRPNLGSRSLGTRARGSVDNPLN